MNNREKGLLGEKKAREYLEEIGYHVLKRNYRSHYGEVDIIAEDQDFLVFIEVKVFNTYKIHDIEYSVGRPKMDRIRKTAKIYLKEFPDYLKSKIRFDIIIVRNNYRVCEHIKNAF